MSTGTKNALGIVHSKEKRGRLFEFLGLLQGMWREIQQQVTVQRLEGEKVSLVEVLDEGLATTGQKLCCIDVRTLSDSIQLSV
jgi:hypothetical protein